MKRNWHLYRCILKSFTGEREREREFSSCASSYVNEPTFPAETTSPVEKHLTRVTYSGDVLSVVNQVCNFYFRERASFSQRSQFAPIRKYQIFWKKRDHKGGMDTFMQNSTKGTRAKRMPINSKSFCSCSLSLSLSLSLFGSPFHFET